MSINFIEMKETDANGRLNVYVVSYKGTLFCWMCQDALHYYYYSILLYYTIIVLIEIFCQCVNDKRAVMAN